MSADQVEREKRTGVGGGVELGEEDRFKKLGCCVGRGGGWLEDALVREERRKITGRRNEFQVLTSEKSLPMQEKSIQN